MLTMCVKQQVEHCLPPHCGKRNAVGAGERNKITSRSEACQQGHAGPFEHQRGKAQIHLSIPDFVVFMKSASGKERVAGPKRVSQGVEKGCLDSWFSQLTCSEGFEQRS